MSEIEADFEISTNNLEAEYEITQSEHFDCSFEIFAAGATFSNITGSPYDNESLANVLNQKADTSTVETLSETVTNNYNTLDAKIDTHIADKSNPHEVTKAQIGLGNVDNTSDLNKPISTATQNALDGKQNTINDLSTIRTNASNGQAAYNTIQTYGDIVTYDASNFATKNQGLLADTALQPNDNISELNNDAGYITSASLPTVNDATITIQKNGSTVESFTLNQSTNETINIAVPTTAAEVNALPDTTTINDLTTSTQQAALNSGANTVNIGQIATNTNAISTEVTNRQNADIALQNQIDAIVSSSDVFDIVGTYAELQAYDIATVPVNDIIKVLVDSTHNDAATYYRCVLSGGVKSWSYIGSEGAYYTKGEADAAFVPQTRTVNGKALSNNITLTASDVGALADNTVIPTVNDSTITLQQNGTTVDSFTLNQASNKTINIETPDDYYTRDEIDSIVPQDVKTPVVYYQPTTSYCYDENNNRFYGSRVSEKLYLVQPKTSGTTQVIDMSTTFSLDFSFKYLGAPSSTFTLAEIIVSSASGKGVLLQVNSGGMYYRNNITSSTVTGTRSLVVGNTYDVRVEYNGTKMVISWKLSTDANYTQINATTCTVSGTYYNYASIGSDGDSIYLPLSSVVLVNDGTTLYDYVAGKIALDYDETLTLDSNQLSVVVDQTYDGTSANPQSGVAIEGELSTNYVKSSAENTSQGITSSIGYVNGVPVMQMSQGNYQFVCGCSGGAVLGAFDTNTNNGVAIGVLPQGTTLVQGNQQALLTLSSNSNLVINGNEVATQTWVGNQGYALASSLATVATSGSYADLLNKPTIPTVNNATLTIQKNGTTVDTFTANASTDVTANITVPTDLGDLTNNAGYTKNVGTVTSVNNVSPVNGNVTIAIPDTSNLANKDLSNLTATGEAHFQAPISDLTTIRSGASAGATAVQPSDITDVVRQETTDTIALYAWNDTVETLYTTTTVAGTCTCYDSNGNFVIAGEINSAGIKLVTTGSIYERDSSKDTTFIRQTLTDNNSNSLNITQSDGQWVISQSILVDTDIELAINTGRTFDLSSYLPSDNYNYEVLVAAVAQSTSTAGSTLNVSVYSDLITNTDDVKICVGRTRANSTIICGGNAIIPIGAGRTIGIHQANISGTASAHKATITNFRAIAYRRIGTNS